ncbi:MAG: T9SS type A sorting domain-containing protein [Bacteroidetes bacterium]|nr:T9SS type A sorting domain-containing protein [Bacteroidota bacterium]
MTKVGFSQSASCGTDEWKQILQLGNSNQAQQEQRQNETIESIVSGRLNPLIAAGGTLIIPTVFHIMHNNGIENIADSIVQSALAELNLRYQNAAPFFDSTGHLVNIQFCLASVDPQGNPTSGITRHQTVLTNFQLTTNEDIALKNIARWSPDLYFNVYVVNNISGFIDGYSTFPFNAGEPSDGVVIEYIYVTNSFLFTHETGHYTGLYHTFQNGCYNLNCLLNGDNVCDTPPDNSSQTFICQGNSCTSEMDDTSGFNPFNVDMDELANYMDYTTCPFAFSQGQANRMESAVSLLRPFLFQSNGCGTNPGQAVPSAGFNFTVSSCNNGEVSFSDSTSMNAITTEWDFDNDGLFEYLGHDFTFAFPSSGTYTVTQRVIGLGGQDTLSQSLTVQKGTAPNFPINFSSIITVDTLKLCQGESVVMQGVGNGVSYLWSTGDTTQVISFVADTSFTLNLIMIDSLGFTWTTLCTPIYIKVNPYQLPAISYADTVGYYCEGSPVQLFVTNPIPGNYQWFQYTVPIGWQNTGIVDTIYTAYPSPTYSSIYYAIYSNVDSSCTGQSNQIVLQSQYLPLTPGYLLSVNGTTMSYPVTNYIYQWYLNGLPIPNATTNSYTATQTGCYQLGAGLNPFLLCEAISDTVCFNFSSVEETSFHDFVISPNPGSNEFQVNFNLNNAATIEMNLYNSLGQSVKVICNKNFEQGTTKIIFSLQDVPPGIYMINIWIAGNLTTRRIVKM